MRLCPIAVVFAGMMVLAFSKTAASAVMPPFPIPVTFESEYKGNGPGECGTHETLTLGSDGIGSERFAHPGVEEYRDSGPWHYEAGSKMLRLGPVVGGDYYAVRDANTLVEYDHNGKPYGPEFGCRTLLTRSPWVIPIDTSRHRETLESQSWQLVALDGRALVRPVEDVLPTLALDLRSRTFSMTTSCGLARGSYDRSNTALRFSVVSKPSGQCDATDAAFTVRLVRALTRTRSFEWCCEHLHLLEGTREVARFRTDRA
jgi:hypothetical protein